MAKTITYKMIWRDLLALDERLKGLDRTSRDREVAAFIDRWPQYFMRGIGPSGVPKIKIDRNMLNFFARTYLVYETPEAFKERIVGKFEKFMVRQYETHARAAAQSAAGPPL